MKITGYLFLLLSLFSNFIIAQELPDTEVYLAEIRINGGRIFFGPARNISFRKGYDNQPFFINDSIFLYSSVREDKQSDIYSYSLNRKLINKVTISNESEYSPKPVPLSSEFSVVMVEKDSTQRIWKYQKNGIIKKVYLGDYDSVAYYAWKHENVVAIVFLGETLVLKEYDLVENKLKDIAVNVGRSLQYGPDGLLYFTQMQDSTRWLCRTEIDGRISRLIEMFDQTEDFVISKENLFFCGKGSVIYFTDMNFLKGWRYCADFARYGVKEIQRLALNPSQNYIAIVNKEAPPGKSGK